MSDIVAASLATAARSYAQSNNDPVPWKALCEAAVNFAKSHGVTPVAVAPAAAPVASGAMVFPPYGRSKGMPVKGATAGDPDFYRNGCLRTLGDESKAKWHDKERALLATIDAEIAAQSF